MSFFEKCGFAAVSHVLSEECQALFTELEKLQDEFLVQEDNFRSPEYKAKWPSDALHWWSRCWEYPFVLYHLKRIGLPNNAQVLDLGSGVTFFPIAVARQAFHVTAVDVDALVAKDLPTATRFVPPLPGTVSVSLSQGDVLPIADESTDVVYSISVLEHLDNFATVISEVHRVLKPSGRFILTIDVDVKGTVSIGSEKFYALLKNIEGLFSFEFGNSIVHPQDLLTTTNTPFPMVTQSDSLYSRVKRGVREIANARMVPSELCCYGAVFKKRDQG